MSLATGRFGDLLGRRFRLSPKFRPARLAELSANEQLAFGEVRADRDIDYLWVPRASGLSAKAVDGQTVSFLLSLRSPRLLVPSERVAFESARDELRRMVLDSILEIELEDGFVTGPTAVDSLGLEDADVQAGTGVRRASLAALEYAAALGLADAPLLSTRLYQFNGEPRSPEWTRRIPSSSALERWLGIDESAPLRRNLDRRWAGSSTHRASQQWFFFREADTKNRRLKLYIAPRPEMLPEALPEIVAVLDRHGIAAFKIGGTLAGILRPDRVVAYADSIDQVHAVGAEVFARIGGLPARAVPFTVALDTAGLASWGVDPPSSERISNWQGPSWRRWITDRLAVAIVSARASGVASPTTFALRRIALDGIDPSTWAPVELPWARDVLA